MSVIKNEDVASCDRIDAHSSESGADEPNATQPSRRWLTGAEIYEKWQGVFEDEFWEEMRRSARPP